MRRIKYVLFIAHEGDKYPFEKAVVFMEDGEEHLQGMYDDLIEAACDMFYSLTEDDEGDSEDDDATNIADGLRGSEDEA